MKLNCYDYENHKCKLYSKECDCGDRAENGVILDEHVAEIFPAKHGVKFAVGLMIVLAVIIVCLIVKYGIEFIPICLLLGFCFVTMMIEAIKMSVRNKMVAVEHSDVCYSCTNRVMCASVGDGKNTKTKCATCKRNKNMMR